MLESDKRELAIVAILTKVEAAYSGLAWATDDKLPYHPLTYLAKADDLHLAVSRSTDARWLTVNGDRILDPRADLLAERIFTHIGGKIQAEQNLKLDQYLSQWISTPELFKLENAAISGLRFNAEKGVCESSDRKRSITVEIRTESSKLTLQLEKKGVSRLRFETGDFPSSVRVDPAQAKELLKLVEAEYARRALVIKARLLSDLEQLVPGNSTDVRIEPDRFKPRHTLKFNYSSNTIIRPDQLEVDLSVDPANGQLKVAFRALEIQPPVTVLLARICFNSNILKLLSAKYLEVCKHYADKVVAKKEEMKSLLVGPNLSLQTLKDHGFTAQLCDGSDEHDCDYRQPGLGPTFRIKSPIVGVSNTILGVIVTRKDSQKLLGVQYHDFKVRFFVQGIAGVNALYSKALGSEYIEGHLAEKLYNVLTESLVKPKDSASVSSQALARPRA